MFFPTIQGNIKDFLSMGWLAPCALIQENLSGLEAEWVVTTATLAK